MGSDKSEVVSVPSWFVNLVKLCVPTILGLLIIFFGYLIKVDRTLTEVLLHLEASKKTTIDLDSHLLDPTIHKSALDLLNMEIEYIKEKVRE